MKKMNGVLIAFLFLFLLFSSNQVLLSRGNNILNPEGYNLETQLGKNYGLIYDSEEWQELPKDIEFDNSLLNLAKNITGLDLSEEEEKKIENYIPLVSFRKLSLPRQYVYDIVKEEFEKTKEIQYENILKQGGIGNRKVKDLIEIESGGFNRLELRFKYYVSRLVLEDNLINYKLFGMIYHPKLESDLLVIVSQTKNYREIEQVINMIRKVRINDEVFSEEELEKMKEILKENEEYFKENQPIFRRKFI